MAKRGLVKRTLDIQSICTMTEDPQGPDSSADVSTDTAQRLNTLLLKTGVSRSDECYIFRYTLGRRKFLYYTYLELTTMIISAKVVLKKNTLPSLCTLGF